MTEPTKEEMKEALNTKVSPEDFTEAEHAAVDKMAAPLIRQARHNKSFLGRRNRNAYQRMNRPHKQDAQEKGASFIFGVIGRFTHG